MFRVRHQDKPAVLRVYQTQTNFKLTFYIVIDYILLYFRFVSANMRMVYTRKVVQLLKCVRHVLAMTTATVARVTCVMRERRKVS